MDRPPQSLGRRRSSRDGRAIHRRPSGQADSKGNPAQRKRALRQKYNNLPLFVRPFALFAYRYFFKLGILDGTEGFIFWTLQTFWFRFLIDSKIWEKRNRKMRQRYSAQQLSQNGRAKRPGTIDSHGSALAYSLSSSGISVWRVVPVGNGRRLINGFQGSVSPGNSTLLSSARCVRNLFSDIKTIFTSSRNQARVDTDQAAVPRWNQERKSSGVTTPGAYSALESGKTHRSYSPQSFFADPKREQSGYLLPIPLPSCSFVDTFKFATHQRLEGIFSGYWTPRDNRTQGLSQPRGFDSPALRHLCPGSYSCKHLTFDFVPGTVRFTGCQAAKYH